MTKKKKEDTMSISDLVVIQDDLKKKIDFSLSDEDLSDDMRVNKILYTTIDKLIEDSLGKEKKQNIDKMKKEMEEIECLKINIQKLVELGREIEKHFIYQNAYLTNHFDKSEENTFKIFVDTTTTRAVSSEQNISNSERVEMMKKVLEVIEVYENKVLKELVAKKEIIKALLDAFKKILKETDFESLSRSDKNYGEEMKNQFTEWLDLSIKLANGREKATTGLETSLDLDKILPNFVLENNGDINQTLSGMEMKVKGDKMIKLINEANKIEEDIETRRIEVSEKLFGKIDSYLEIPTEKSQNKDINITNPLQDKAWFRLCKVVYIGLYGLAIIFGLFLWSEETELGFWFVAITIIIFTLIKKAFYYIVLGKSFLQ